MVFLLGKLPEAQKTKAVERYGQQVAPEAAEEKARSGAPLFTE